MPIRFLSYNEKIDQHKVKNIRVDSFENIQGDIIKFLDKGGIIHVKDFKGGIEFIDLFYEECISLGGITKEEWNNIFIKRKILDIRSFANATNILKVLVHNHAFSMAILGLLEKIGCSLEKTHVDCGVIRYQLTGNLRKKVEESKYFKKEDFKRKNSKSIPEIFGYGKLPPHRDVRWPHIRIIGGWMPLTDIEEEEALTLFPDVFSEKKAITDPNITDFPEVSHPNELKLGRPFAPKMKAGDFLIFNASTVHCSPVIQNSQFRGSIDFRVAYPCIDDFEHYKSTFIQSKNLIHINNKENKIDLEKQMEALVSYKDLLFGRSGNNLTIFEIYNSYKLKKRKFDFWIIYSVVSKYFCPDTCLKICQKTNRFFRFVLLLMILIKSKSYFWLYQGYLCSSSNYHLILKILFKIKTINISKKTKLKIVNKPVKWEGDPRETLPEEVLRRLT